MDLFNNKKIDALELEVTFLKQKLADKSESLQQLRNSVDTETDINELLKKKEILLTEFEPIHSEWQEKMDTLAGIDSVLLQKQMETNELSLKLETLEQSIRDKTEEHESIEADMPKMRQELQSLEREVFNLRETAGSLQHEIDRKTSINDGLTATIDENRIIIGEMETKVNNKDVYLAEITELENHEVEIKKRINQLIEHKEALDGEVAKTSTQLEKVNGEYSELKTGKLKLEEEVTGMLAKFSEDINELTQKNRGLIGEYTRYTEDKINTEKELLNLKSETDALRSLKNQFKESIYSKEAELSDLNNLIDIVKRELMEYENQKEAVRIMLKESEEKLLESHQERDKLKTEMVKFIKGLSTDELHF